VYLSRSTRYVGDRRVNFQRISRDQNQFDAAQPKWIEHKFFLQNVLIITIPNIVILWFNI